MFNIADTLEWREQNKKKTLISDRYDSKEYGK